VLFLHEMDLVGANVVRPKLVRTPAKVAGELADRLQVSLPRTGGERTDLHVFEHALTKRMHDEQLLSSALCRDWLRSGKARRVCEKESPG